MPYLVIHIIGIVSMGTRSDLYLMCDSIDHLMIDDMMISNLVTWLPGNLVGTITIAPIITSTLPELFRDSEV